MSVFDCPKISMKKGSTGDNVKKLQEYLKQWNYYSKSIDSDYGDFTVNAVKQFQKAYNLTVDGWFGSQTCKKFNEVVESKEKTKTETTTKTTTTPLFDCPSINLSKGSKGDNVKKLQTILKDLGYYTRQVDGDYGDYTVKAVKEYQKTQTTLLVDGIFGPVTCGKLNATYSAKKGIPLTPPVVDNIPSYAKELKAELTLLPTVVVLPDVELDTNSNSKSVTEGSIITDTNFDCTKINLTKGSKGEDVKKLQTILKARGYYTRQVDGDFGDYTATAVKKLQQVQGNSADGVFGPKTCSKLQGSSTTSATQQKNKNYVIKDFKNYTTSNDADALSYEVTIHTIYTKDKLMHMRRLQKTEFKITHGKTIVYEHKGYINEIKIQEDSDALIIELQLVGYTVFLEKTLETYEKTAKRSELIKDLIKLAGLKADVDLMGIPDEEYTLKITQQQANTTSSSSGGGDGSAGLTQLSGSDCTDTWSLSAYSFDIDTCKGNTKIGNSSANYAQDTKDMTAKQAIKDLIGRFRYSSYSNNRTCPRSMWNKNGTIRGNCADAARLTKALGEVHGLKVGIHHWSNGSRGHYFNVIEVNGKTYRFDCCFQSGYSNGYGNELCNNLTKNGGPWQ